MRNLQEALTFYRARHKTTGCIITHAIGVPFLVLAPLALLTGKRKAARFFFTNGMFLQWLGHAVFEKNEPSLVETKDPMMVAAALIFVAEKWNNVLTGKPLHTTRTYRFAAQDQQLDIAEKSAEAETKQIESMD